LPWPTSVIFSLSVLPSRRADAAASVLPDSSVQEQDILIIDVIRYRVTEVKPQNCFGAITHIDLHLELEKCEVNDG